MTSTIESSGSSARSSKDSSHSGDNCLLLTVLSNCLSFNRKVTIGSEVPSFPNNRRSMAGSLRPLMSNIRTALASRPGKASFSSYLWSMTTACSGLWTHLSCRSIVPLFFFVLPLVSVKRYVFTTSWRCFSAERGILTHPIKSFPEKRS